MSGTEYKELSKKPMYRWDSDVNLSFLNAESERRRLIIGSHFEDEESAPSTMWWLA